MGPMEYQLVMPHWSALSISVVMALLPRVAIAVTAQYIFPDPVQVWVLYWYMHEYSYILYITG